MRIRFAVVNPTNRKRALIEGTALRVKSGPDDAEVSAAGVSSGCPLVSGQPINVSVELRSRKGDRLLCLSFDRDAIEKMLTALVETEKLLGREPVGIGAPRPGYQTLNAMPTDADARKDLPKRRHHDESLSHPGRNAIGKSVDVKG